MQCKIMRLTFHGLIHIWSFFPRAATDHMKFDDESELKVKTLYVPRLTHKKLSILLQN